MKYNVGTKMLVAVAVFGAATIVFGLSRNIVLSIACLALLGSADMVSVYVRQSLIQLYTPDAMRGRVGAASTLFISASNELGEAESGFLAALIGPVVAVVAGGVGAIAVTLLWARWFPELQAGADLRPAGRFAQGGRDGLAVTPAADPRPRPDHHRVPHSARDRGHPVERPRRERNAPPPRGQRPAPADRVRDDLQIAAFMVAGRARARPRPRSAGARWRHSRRRCARRGNGRRRRSEVSAADSPTGPTASPKASPASAKRASSRS